MSTVDRRLHDRALQLAASAIDFALGSAEAAELGDHLAACSPCARSAAALRLDAAAIRLPALLPSRRVDDAVYAAIAGRDRRASSSRLLVLAAAALLLVALLGVAAAGALLRVWPTLPIVVQPTAPAIVVNPSPSAMPAPSPTPTLPADTLILAVAGDGETRVVVTMRPDGEQYEALAFGDWAVWSPDGRSIAYSCRSGEAGPYGNICVMNADGSGQRLVIADGLFPKWSPDGTQILFSRSAIDAGDTWVASADGTNARKVGDGAGSWAPDGEWILLLGASGAAPDATIVHPDGTGARGLGTCWNATWSPEGSRLACTRWDEVHGTLYTIDVDSGGATTTLLEADVAIGDPLWMDSRLAITMTRAGSSPGALPPENDLFLFDVAPGDLRQLTHGLSIMGPIDVSGAGAWLAFTAADGDTRNVHIVSDAGETRPVTSNGTTGQPRWQVITTSPGPAPTSAPTPSASGGWALAPSSPVFDGAEIMDIAAAAQQYVAVGVVPGNDASGRSVPMTGAWTSLDGLRWTSARDAPTRGRMVALAAGHGRVVAVGDASTLPGETDVRGAIWVSSDGRSWTRVTDLPVPTPSLLADVVATPTGFVAVGSFLSTSQPHAMALVSRDGVSWERAAMIEKATGRTMSGILVGGPGLIAYGFEDAQDAVAGVIWSSRDGRTWNKSEDAPGFLADDGGGCCSRRIELVFGVKDQWFAIATPGPATFPTFSSADGIHWTALGATGLTSIRPRAVIWSGGEWLAVGVTAPGATAPLDAAAWRSRDGTTWMPITVEGIAEPEVDRQVTALAAGPHGPVAVGYRRTGDGRVRGLVWVLGSTSRP